MDFMTQRDANPRQPEDDLEADRQTIAPTSQNGGVALFTGGAALHQREPRNLKPLLFAGSAVLLVLLVLLLVGHRAQQAANPGGAGLAPSAAYASSLPLTNIQMSDSTNLSGGKITYLDGVVTNRGAKTITGITVQVAFKDFTNMLAAKDTLPLNLIRAREPYVDTEPVSVAPLAPGQSHAFRLIFDSVPDTWDGAYPQVRVIAVDTK